MTLSRFSHSIMARLSHTVAANPAFYSPAKKPLFAGRESLHTGREVIDRQGSVLGKVSRGLMMPRLRSLDINDELDFAFAEFLMSKSKSAAQESGA